jgi:hypothetical protein
MKKIVTLATALCLCVMLLSGCYGPFRLTKKVYDWNGSVPNKWGREALFLVMNVLPVYGFSVFADAIFFNLIEFWGGDNPLAANAGGLKAKYIAKGDKQAVMTFSKTGKKVRIDLFNNHRPGKYLLIESANDGSLVARDSGGDVIMSAKTLNDGSVFVTDGKGREVACHIPEEAN